jgi:hypothetical protein
LKSKVTWSKEVDENTKFFHYFSNQRKKSNTIWEMKNEEGVMVSNFSKGVQHFQSIYSEPARENI